MGQNIYEAKDHYKNTKVAQRYHSKFYASLVPSNMRQKIVGVGEVRAFQKMLALVDSKGSVLDIACGTGRYVELLLNKEYQVGGIDISNQMLTIARERCDVQKNLLFLQQGDAQYLPFDDKQFNGITCMRLYHRVPPLNRVDMLREIKRVKKDWAILFFGMATPWLDLRQKIRGQLIKGRDSNPYPVKHEQLLDELSSADLQIIAKSWVLPFVTSGLIVLVS